MGTTDRITAGGSNRRTQKGSNLKNRLRPNQRKLSATFNCTQSNTCLRKVQAGFEAAAPSLVKSAQCVGLGPTRDNSNDFRGTFSRSVHVQSEETEREGV